MLPLSIRDYGIEAVNNWLIGVDLKIGNHAEEARTRFLEIIKRIYKEFFTIIS